LKKTLVALVLSLLLALSLSLPAFGFLFPGFRFERTAATGSMSHSAGYDLNGTIDFKKQAGHLCNTGAEAKQVIIGDGAIVKSMDIHMVGGKLTVNDENDWVAAADSLRGLAVTSVIELCAPPKSLFTEQGALYASLVALFTEYLFEKGLDLEGLFNNDSEMVEQLLAGFPKYLKDNAAPPLWQYLESNPSNYKSLLHSFMVYGLFMLRNYEDWSNDELIEQLELLFGIDSDNLPEDFDPFEALNNLQITDPLTQQIWAVSVLADPGQAGTLNQDFEAAYGPWGGISIPYRRLIPDYIWNGIPDNLLSQIPESFYMFDNGGDDSFWFDFEDYPAYTVDSGPDYVGNYFNIDQYAYVSQGVMKRYIDVSSPWSHGYLTEDAQITGMARVSESFSMKNLPAGSDAPKDWWKLF
jgi:hypothetical protein